MSPDSTTTTSTIDPVFATWVHDGPGGRWTYDLVYLETVTTEGTLCSTATEGACWRCDEDPLHWVTVHRDVHGVRVSQNGTHIDTLRCPEHWDHDVEAWAEGIAPPEAQRIDLTPREGDRCAVWHGCALQGLIVKVRKVYDGEGPRFLVELPSGDLKYLGSGDLIRV